MAVLWHNGRPIRQVYIHCICLESQIEAFCTRLSEFGIPAMPDIRTVDHWLDGNTKDRWPQSKTMAQHCRAGAFERRFAVVMNENFRFTTDLERYV